MVDPPARGDEGPYLSTPREVPGGWLASASSSEVGDVESAVVYDGGTDAPSFEPVEGTERDGVAFGELIEDGDRLVIPEYDDGQVVAFIELS